MTLEQYSAVVDAWVWIDQQIHMYGPGLALTAACIAISWTCSKVRAWREKRRVVREQRATLRLERQQMARLRDAINHAPQIPTQPGHDDDLLTACWDAWKATHTDSQEKDRP